MEKSMMDEAFRFLKYWKDRLRDGKWPDFFEDILRIEAEDVDLPENVLASVRATVVSLIACFLPWHREMLHLTAKHGRFEVLPMILHSLDNCHEQKFGQTAAHVAAQASRVASVAVLASHDITTLYDEGSDGSTPYDILYSLFHKSLLSTGGSDSPARIYTYGENVACSLGHGSGESVAAPRPLGLKVEAVKNCTISLGRYHTLMLIDGKVYSCGLGRDGRLGLGDESDVALPQEIFLGDRNVIAISAGLNHSVICTDKEVIVFGKNTDGKLGIKELKALLPTVAYTMKNPQIVISKCFAGAKYSAVITSDGKCIAAGSVPWETLPRDVNVFAAASIPVFNHHTVNFFDNFLVAMQRFHKLTKVEVLSLNGSYSTDLAGRYECVGAIGSNLTIMLRSLIDMGKEPSFFVLCGNLQPPDVIFIELRFEFYSSSVYLKNLELSPSGEFIAISSNDLVYEGCIREDVVLATPPSCYPERTQLHVELSRVVALPPALKIFISPDGKNKAIFTVGISLDKLVTVRQPALAAAPSEADEELVEVVCMDEFGNELGVFTAQRNRLIKESEYCGSFLHRWCEQGDALDRITFVDEIHLVETFLRYCDQSLQLDELCESELFELLRFADRYLCQRLFAYALNAILRKPFKMLTMRNLYEVSRNVANEELSRCVDSLGAYLLPLMLDHGLAQQLTPSELRRIELRYSALDPQVPSIPHPKSFAVDNHRPICHFAINMFRSFGAMFSQLDDMDDFGDALNAFVQKEKSRMFRAARQVPRDPVDEEAYESPETTSRKGGRSSERSGGGASTEAEIEPRESQVSQVSRNTLPELIEADIGTLSVASNLTANQGSDVNGWRVPKDVADEAITVSPSESRTVAALAAFELRQVPSSSSPGSSSAGAIHDDLSRTPSMAARPHHEGLAPSTSRIVPSRTERPQPWGGVCLPAANSLAEIVADEVKRAGNSREDKTFVKNEGTTPAETGGEPKGWSNGSCPAESNEQPRGLEEIMAAEVASQNEARRLNDSNLADIEIEEQAMAQLRETYEAMAAIGGASMTVDVERFQANASDPLWAARR